MTRHLLIAAVAATTLAVLTPPAKAVKLFDENDNVLAIDLDIASASPGHGNENSDKAVDQVFIPGPPPSGTTKYLNFGKEQTGVILTPTTTGTIVQSLQLRAANDSPSRDPLTYELYGTNSAISSQPHSLGDGEAWTFIGSGSTGLDADPGRHELGTTQDIVNGSTYDSYKIVFPTIRDTNAGDADSMQVADIQLFTDLAGGGSALLSTTTLTVPITHDAVKSNSNYPGGEAPMFALDGITDVAGNKYLNFADTNSGLIVSRADGKPTVVTSLTFTTGGDAPGRDPLEWALYGTDDAIISGDNSRGDAENWTLVDTGLTDLLQFPEGDMIGRNQTGAAQSVGNSTPYGAYRLVFTELRGGPAEGIMQVAEINFNGRVIPEPSSIVILGMGAIAAVAFARRQMK